MWAEIQIKRARGFIDSGRSTRGGSSEERKPMPATVSNTASLQLVRILQLIFAAQARDVLSKVNLDDVMDGKIPDTSHWIAPTVQATKPILLQFFQTGVLRTQLDIQTVVHGRKPEQEMRRIVVPTSEFLGGRKGVMCSGDKKERVHSSPTKRSLLSLSILHVDKAFHQSSHGGRPYIRKAANIRIGFDLFNPKILDAVDAATMQFCRETNDTATSELTQAVRDLRSLLKRGLERGEATSLLARKIRQIFADPGRAWRIATTESSRAIHAGDLMAAKDSELAQTKSWLASSDACDRCLDLADKGEVELDKPYYVDPKGGPYAIVYHPPLHPSCFCSQTFNIAGKSTTAKPVPVATTIKPPRAAPTEITTPVIQPAGAITRPVISFEQKFLQAFDRLDAQTGGSNFVNLRQLRQAMPEFTQEQFDAGIRELQRLGRAYLRASEGRHGITPEDRAAGIIQGDVLHLHVSRMR